MECEGGYTARRPWEGVCFQAVRSGLTSCLAGVGNLPSRVVKAFDNYLRCGNPGFGFSHVKCGACGKSWAVAFSCKGPLCPSCTNRRAEEAAFHWEGMLPLGDFRMWTLSLPRGLRFLAVKNKAVFLGLQRGLVQAVGRWQRGQLRRYFKGRELKGGALVFVQWFGSALQLTPHFHVLVPEALWTRTGERVSVPSPKESDLEEILKRLLRQLAKKFGELEFTEFAEEGYEATQVEAIQQRLPFSHEEIELPKTRKPMVAVVEGFSLHVARRIPEKDREGLRNVIRYAARGPVSEKRVKLLEDGRVRYETKRGQVLHFTPETFVRRLAALVPPKGMHLTVGYGVFASASSTRDKVVRTPKPLPQEEQPSLPFSEGKKKAKRPRINWAELLRRTFFEDVLKCPCGGRRRVVAVITKYDEAREMLKRMRVEVPPVKIRARDKGPPEDKQLKLAV